MAAELAPAAPVADAPGWAVPAEHQPPGLREVAEEQPSSGRNFAALLSGQVVTWTMTLLWTLIVPRVLGPAGFGIVTAALSVSGVLGILVGLGTRSYLVRELVMHRHRAAKLVGTAIVLRLLLAPLVALAAFAFAHFAHYGHERSLALYLAAASNLVLLMYDPMQSTFQAFERMKYLAISDVINKTAQSAIGIVIALAGLGAIGILANMTVVAVVVLLLNLVWMRRYLRVDVRTTPRLLAGMARGSLVFWASGVFFTIYLWIDTILLSTMAPTRVVGWYGASTTLFQTLMFLPVLLGTTWLPRFVAAFKEGPAQLLETARRPLELVLVLSLPIAAGTAAAARLIVHLLYGAAYAPAAPVMVILGLCLPATYVSIMFAQVMIAAGRQVVFTWLMMGATALNPLLNLVLIPMTQAHQHNGAIGAALALLVTEIAVAAGAYLAVGRRIFSRGTARRALLAGGAAGGMWAVATLAQPLGQVPALLCGVTALGALIVIFRVPTEEEISYLGAGVRGVASRLRRQPREGT